MWNSMLDFETPWPFHPEDKTNHLTQKCNKHKLSSAVVSNFSFWLRAGGSSGEQRFTPGSYHSACCLLCNTDVCLCAASYCFYDVICQKMFRAEVWTNKVIDHVLIIYLCIIIHNSFLSARSNQKGKNINDELIYTVRSANNSDETNYQKLHSEKLIYGSMKNL